MQKRIRWKPKGLAKVRASLHEEVAAHLGTLIVEGGLQPGDTLPNEFSLGQEMGVSRTAIREAMKVLSAKGLVVLKRKTGTQVRPRVEWNVLDPQLLTWMFSGGGLIAGLKDLSEIRQAIEPVGARMAAERANTDQLLQIEAAFQEMEVALSDPTARVEPDLRFHLAVLDATHNAFMRPFGALIQTALRASFGLTSRDDEAYKRSLQQHKAVVDAIAKRNGNKAEAAMHTVLAQTLQDINRHVADFHVVKPDAE